MTKNKGYLFAFFAVLLMFCGCNKAADEKNVYMVGKEINKEEITKEVQENTEGSEFKSIEIGFANVLSADIGMISLIDPVTGEQVNADSLLDGEVLTIESTMPKDVNTIEWAVYNINGELYCSGATDITEAEQSVYIIMTGNGSVDDVKVVFDNTEDEVKTAIKNLK